MRNLQVLIHKPISTHIIVPIICLSYNHVFFFFVTLITGNVE